jgi:elongation factor G
VCIKADVPVAELGDYQMTLKSLTGGEGAYPMSFDHYGRVCRQMYRNVFAQSLGRQRNDLEYSLLIS